MNPLDLLEYLNSCPAGKEGWKLFEDICTNILSYLFIPPLQNPRIQARTFSGIDRRDAIFPNRNFDNSNIWGQLFQELNARLVLFEFKNYNSSNIGKTEINQTSNYLNPPMGRLAILCSNKIPVDSAFIRRNTIFSNDKKVILFLLPTDLEEMIYIKERGEDPADLIMDKVEEFYIQHE